MGGAEAGETIQLQYLKPAVPLREEVAGEAEAAIDGFVLGLV